MNVDYRGDVSTLLRGQLAARSRDDTITIRPIEPADRDIEQEFVRGLSPSSRYQRFLTHIKELSPALLDRFTNLRFPDSMALLAAIPAEIGERHVGAARYAREGTANTEDIAVAAADEARELGDNQYRSTTAQFNRANRNRRKRPFTPTSRESPCRGHDGHRWPGMREGSQPADRLR